MNGGDLRFLLRRTVGGVKLLSGVGYWEAADKVKGLLLENSFWKLKLDWMSEVQFFPSFLRQILSPGWWGEWETNLHLTAQSQEQRLMVPQVHGASFDKPSSSSTPKKSTYQSGNHFHRAPTWNPPQLRDKIRDFTQARHNEYDGTRQEGLETTHRLSGTPA